MEPSFSLAEFWGGVAVLLGILGYVFYIRGILAGKVKPHAFSWLVWAIITTIGFLAQLVDNAGPGAWVMGFTALASYAFFFVGLGASSRQYIKKEDWWCFAFSLASIPLWYFTGDPLWSVILITLIDVVAFAPTFRKAYEHPGTEHTWTYGLSGIKFVFSLFALTNITLVTALYPASLVVANLAFVVMVFFRKRKII